MTESHKTLTFMGVALMALLLAWEPWAYEKTVTEQSESGQALFPKFDDALKAKSMEVTEYDEATSHLRPFKIAQVDGVWAIPSQQNYPADARDHLAQAATSLIGLKTLSFITNNSGEHSTYGVVDPDVKSLKRGATGVGTRVTFKGDKDAVLADLIIGKQVKGQTGLRYVRRADKDVVYTVSLKIDQLSTKFEDWIEKDLLKLNSFDITQVQLDDYSIEEVPTPQGLSLAKMERSEVNLGYDDAKSSWNLLKYLVFKDKKFEPTKLAADEELNSEKLNGMKSALDDLKIVDVERKPKGMSQDLKVSEDFIKNNETFNSLVELGFYPMRGESGKFDILSSEGEVICRMKDGVEYLLRFGRTTQTEQSVKKDDADKPESKTSNLGRYMFVSAQFNESLLAKPELKPLSGAEAPPATPDKTDAGKPEAGKPEAKPEEGKTDATKTDAVKPDAPGPQLGSPDAKKECGDEGADDPADAKAPATDAKDSTAKDPAAKAPADAKLDDKAPATDAKQPAAKAPAAVEEPSADVKAAAEQKKREEIERDNKRKQDEYDAKVKKGQDHAKELNERFADWYYVISEDVYAKIHLGHDDIVKKKAAKEGDKKEGDAAGNSPLDFDALKNLPLKPQ